MENKFKGTPGNWSLVYNEDGTLEEGMAGTNRVTGIKSDNGFGEIAMVIHRKTNILGDSKKLEYQTFEANARLIAAAPTMLETLERITNCNDLATAQEYAREMISKATEK
jgi:hypothetical protein